MRFKNFLLKENSAYLGTRIGDILNAISDLKENGKSMGSRQMTQAAEGIANQIRRILHGSWDRPEMPTLHALQKVGVALMRAIEEKGDDLQNVLSSSEEALQKITSDLGNPINSLGSPQSQEAPEKESPLQPTQGQEPRPPQPQKPLPPQHQAEVGTVPEQGPTSGPPVPQV